MPTEDGDGVPARRGQAVDHQRRRRRAGRGDGAGAAARRREGRDHRVRRRDRLPGHHRREPQRLHGPEGPRERRHPLPPGAGPGREPARPRGRGPQDRPDHPQHRPPVDPGRCASAPASGASRSPASGRRERVQWGRPVGRARRGRAEDLVHRRDHLRDGGGASTCPRSWPTPAARTSGSRRRWPSSGPARWPGRSPTSWCRSAAAAATRPPTRWPPAASAPCPPSRSCATCGSTGSSRARPRSCTC